MKALIEKLQAQRDLDSGDVRYGVAALLSDSTTDTLKAQFLTALHKKGESADEIAEFVRVLIERAIDPMIETANLPGPVIDVCGTGGDGLDLFNVSTTIMFILAAGGVVVVKHGNRSVTSACGSADVLEQLGVPINLDPEALNGCLERFGVAFIFARKYHPAFRAIANMRKRLAQQNQRTVFNLLGPLLNPARPPRQLIGVFAPRLTTIFSEVLRRLGRERAWVVHGLTETGAGMDDISVSAATTIADLQNDKVQTGVVDPGFFGVPRAPVDELRGGDSTVNAAILEGILAGTITGAKRDLALVNAAAGFVVAGVAADMREAIDLARAQIDSGRALEKLRSLQRFGNELHRKGEDG
jgi:anthranilate phosphoribosyltransferase